MLDFVSNLTLKKKVSVYFVDIAISYLKNNYHFHIIGDIVVSRERQSL